MNHAWLDLLLLIWTLSRLNIIHALFPKIYVTKETKQTIVKAFNMLTNENEAKTMRKHISRLIHIKKWNNKACKYQC